MDRPIHPFAYRVHTHKLGKVVTGYVFNNTEGFRKIGKGNPQWPQAFYPIKEKMQINPTEIIVARCTFSTVGFSKDTRIGQTAGDEMCNLYLMFYTDSRDPESHYIDCGDESYPDLSKAIPAESDIPLPRNKTLEEHAMGHGMNSNANDEGLYCSVRNVVLRNCFMCFGTAQGYIKFPAVFRNPVSVSGGN